MKIVVVTLFPEFVQQSLRHGVLGRAVERGVLSVDTVNPRQFVADVHKTVDDRPYGGGPGMVLKAEPLRLAMSEAMRQVPAARRIYLAADGAPVTQRKVAELAGLPQLVLVAGRYEGVDERFVEACTDESLSVADVVLSGGELPALMVIDAVARLLPGTLMPSRPCRSRSRTACSTGRTTLGRRSGPGGRCRRCCSAATTPRSAAGGCSSRWDGPGCAGPTCCGSAN